MQRPSRDWPHRAPRGPRQVDGSDDGERLAAQQHRVSGLAGEIGAGAHRDSSVCLGQRGGVVDAIADHGDLVSRGLQTAYAGELFLGEQAAEKASMPTCFAIVSAPCGRVAGQHDGLQPALLQRRNRLGLPRHAVGPRQ
jgi:hypothetical protein